MDKMDTIETSFHIPYELSPRGVSTLMGMLLKLNRSTSLFYTPEISTITLTCPLSALDIHCLAINHAVTFFAMQKSLDTVSDDETIDDSASMLSHRGDSIDDNPVQSASGWFVERNSDGKVLPLTAEHEGVLETWGPLGDKVRDGVWGVWDKLVGEGGNGWEWGLCDVLRQYGSVEETLAVIAGGTGTKLVVYGDSQVVRIWGETDEAVKNVVQILSALNTVKYPAPNPYTANLIRPEGFSTDEKVYRLTSRHLTYNLLASQTFVNPGHWPAHSAYRQMARSGRFYMLQAERSNDWRWEIVKFPELEPVDVKGVPVRAFKVYTTQEKGDVDELEGLLEGLKVEEWNMEVDPWAPMKPRDPPQKIPRRRGSFEKLAAEKKAAITTFRHNNPLLLEPTELQLENTFATSPCPRPLPHVTSRTIFSSMKSRSSFDTAWRTHVATCLNRARSFPGDVFLSLVFGRLMIRRANSPDFKFSDNDLLVQLKDMADMSPETWATGSLGFLDPAVIALNRRDQSEAPNVGWTQILSCDVTDMQRFEGRAKGIGFNWLGCKTFIEFSCRDSTGREFIVSWRVDTAEKSEILVRPGPAEAQIGRVNMHWPANRFDVRTVVSAYDGKYFRRRYSDFINFLRANTTVKSINASLATVAVVYPNLGPGEPVQILKPLLVGIHNYEDTGRRHQLHLRSCHYITTTTTVTPDTRQTLGKTTPASILTSSGLPTRWWELSIKSKQVQEILKENKSLSLGMIAKWHGNQKELAGEKGAVKTLRDVAMRVGLLLADVGKGEDNGVVLDAKGAARKDPEMWRGVLKMGRKELGEGAFKKGTAPVVGAVSGRAGIGMDVGMGRGMGRGAGRGSVPLGGAGRGF